MVTMPKDAFHNGTSKANTFSPPNKRSRTKRFIDRIGMALSHQLKFQKSNSEDGLQEMKRQGYETDTYRISQTEYIELIEKVQNDRLQSLLQRLNKSPLQKLRL